MAKIRRIQPGTTSIHVVPIALKFTLFIAVLVIAFMTWQTFTAIDLANKSLDEEVQKSGVLLSTALATLIEPEWLEDPSHKAKLEAALARFREPVSAHVLDIIAYNSRNEPVATATGKRSFEKTIPEGQRVHNGGAETAGVDVLEFEYDGLPVRSFSLQLRPAPAPDPPLAGSPGRIEVYISASEIEDARRKLARAMIQVTAASSVAASIGAFLLARFLTRPIRALLKDMKHVALGHLGHQSSVKSSDELGELAHAFNAMTASLQEAQEAKLTQQALEHDLALATKIQERLLPRAMPQLEGFDITHHYQPAKEVGGDYYDFVKIDAEHVGFVVADVSGKGIPASLVMTMTRTLLRAAARGETSPARTVEMVNRSLTPDMGSGMFVTLVYFVLNVKTREVRLVRSGHNPPLVYSTRHQKLLHLRPRGMALGLDREGSLFLSELKVQRLTLQPGDVLVAHTDGIVEGKSREGTDYSDARLEEVIAANAAGSASHLVQAIVTDLAEHERGTEPSDDVTLLVLKAT